jgi:hypothetical protein
VTNTGTASGTFDDATSASASASATATVTGVNCAKITPTNTTCSDFASGSAAVLDTLLYNVKDGNINSVAPGVFFYWIGVQGSAGSNTFTIQQAITTGNFDSHYFSIAAGSNVFDSSCNAVSGASLTQSGASVSVVFNAVSSGFFYIGVKFDSTSVKGFAAPAPSTVHYDFSALDASNSIITGSLQGINLMLK